MGSACLFITFLNIFIMRHLIVFFAVIFISFGSITAKSGIVKSEVGVERFFNGGTIEIEQGVHNIRVTVTDNAGNAGFVKVVNSSGRIVFNKPFVGDAIIIVNKDVLSSDTYTLTAKAGSTIETLVFKK